MSEDESQKGLNEEILHLIGTLLILEEMIHLLEIKIRIAEMEIQKEK